MRKPRGGGARPQQAGSVDGRRTRWSSRAWTRGRPSPRAPAAFAVPLASATFLVRSLGAIGARLAAGTHQERAACSGKRGTRRWLRRPGVVRLQAERCPVPIARAPSRAAELRPSTSTHAFRCGSWTIWLGRNVIVDEVVANLTSGPIQSSMIARTRGAAKSRL